MSPLMGLVKDLRSRGFNVPNPDPNDGGVKARALFLLETPGPKAVSFHFISCDNPDPTARNMACALHDAGFARCDVVLWNVVPYCISTTQKRNVTLGQIRQSAVDTQAFIDLLPRLEVVVFCGRAAQRARRLLNFPPTVRVYCTFQTAAQAFNRKSYREHIDMTFKKARELISN